MPYYTPPAARIAYDIDGTIVIHSKYDDKTLTVMEISPDRVALMNNERSGHLAIASYSGDDPFLGSDMSKRWVTFLFPSKTHVAGIFALVIDNGYSGVHYVQGVNVWGSPNSTNGVDGDWNLLSADVSSFAVRGTRYNGTDLFTANDTYRRNFADGAGGIVSLSGANTRNLTALRLAVVSSGSYGYKFKVHLYGEADTGAIEDRLQFWQNSSDLPVQGDWFNWGDTPIGSSAQKSFRIRNMSSSRTASSIVVSFQDGNSTTDPSPAGMMLLSIDGGTTWNANITIPSMSAGSVSPSYLVRLITPTTSAMSNWAPRITAVVGAWT